VYRISSDGRQLLNGSVSNPDSRDVADTRLDALTGGPIMPTFIDQGFCVITSDSAAMSHVGRVRERNEDFAYIDDRMWIVADGIGGHAHGDLAAQTAVTAAAEHLHTHGVNALTVAEAVEVADDMIQDRFGGRLAGPRSPGSTLVIAARHDDGERVIGAWVGDSRAYLWTGDPDSGEQQLTRLTYDHADQHGGLSQAMGHLRRGHRLSTIEFFPNPGDRLLLCTDGLSKMLPEDTISDVFRLDRGAVDTSSALIANALDRGGYDNVTVTVTDL
jgi:serine/threonine protein phosphatase PrpC